MLKIVTKSDTLIFIHFPSEQREHNLTPNLVIHVPFDHFASQPRRVPQRPKQLKQSIFLMNNLLTVFKNVI